ncbi:hypothetical protein B0H17DRAFT_1324275 [Mycena rosella]|uniref:Uncharacterized protein n=1 Tax=Mycena rosella TaxID=1033263 RepID=A0AAD7H2V7_MYCRO|nr:hypothetical protein B0H17DRAFT_1324275 [Mycena rosella]
MPWVYKREKEREKDDGTPVNDDLRPRRKDGASADNRRIPVAADAGVLVLRANEDAQQYLSVYSSPRPRPDTRLPPSSGDRQRVELYLRIQLARISAFRARVPLRARTQQLSSPAMRLCVPTSPATIRIRPRENPLRGGLLRPERRDGSGDDAPRARTARAVDGRDNALYLPPRAAPGAPFTPPKHTRPADTTSPALIGRLSRRPRLARRHLRATSRSARPAVRILPETDGACRAAGAGASGGGCSPGKRARAFVRAADWNAHPPRAPSRHYPLRSSLSRVCGCCGRRLSGGAHSPAPPAYSRISPRYIQRLSGAYGANAPCAPRPCASRPASPAPSTPPPRSSRIPRPNIRYLVHRLHPLRCALPFLTRARGHAAVSRGVASGRAVAQQIEGPRPGSGSAQLSSRGRGERGYRRCGESRVSGAHQMADPAVLAAVMRLGSARHPPPRSLAVGGRKHVRRRGRRRRRMQDTSYPRIRRDPANIASAWIECTRASKGGMRADAQSDDPAVVVPASGGRDACSPSLSMIPPFYGAHELRLRSAASGRRACPPPPPPTKDSPAPSCRMGVHAAAGSGGGHRRDVGGGADVADRFVLPRSGASGTSVSVSMARGSPVAGDGISGSGPSAIAINPFRSNTLSRSSLSGSLLRGVAGSPGRAASPIASPALASPAVSSPMGVAFPPGGESSGSAGGGGGVGTPVRTRYSSSFPRRYGTVGSGGSGESASGSGTGSLLAPRERTPSGSRSGSFLKGSPAAVTGAFSSRAAAAARRGSSPDDDNASSSPGTSRGGIIRGSSSTATARTVTLGGAMLTSESEVDERLRRMNAEFVRSLVGLGGRRAGGGWRSGRGRAGTVAPLPPPS